MCACQRSYIVVPLDRVC